MLNRNSNPDHPERVPTLVIPYDNETFLAPPPGGYPPAKPGPGEPGFVPPPSPTPPTPEDRIAGLKLAMRVKGNQRQVKNILAVIKDLEETGTAARFYQDGKAIEKSQYDATKGAVWGENSSNYQFVSSAVFPSTNMGNQVSNSSSHTSFSPRIADLV